MTWKIAYTVRPADPYDRREHPDAHEIMMDGGGNLVRMAGVYKTKAIADAVARELNHYAGSQIR